VSDGSGAEPFDIDPIPFTEALERALAEDRETQPTR
jgi:hypothetical protein